MSNLTTLTNEQLELIKSTVAKGATDNELKLFLYRCKEIGLDPLKPGQIFFIKYGTGPGTIVIGRDGFRARAASIGLHTGTKVGIIRDEKGFCLGAWCEVYRKDWKEPAREEVSLKEYNTGKGQWAKMPETMIKKVAEVAALRMAFPDQLSGLYSTDEMDQAVPIPSENKSVKLPIKTLAEVSKDELKEMQQSLNEDQINAEKQELKDSKINPTEKPKAGELGFRVPEHIKKKLAPGEYVSQFGSPGGEVLGKKLKDIPIDILLEALEFLRFGHPYKKPAAELLKKESTQEFILKAEEWINHQKDESLQGSFQD